ncbi:large ribosomal subunit protein uL30-like [Topomyia yanbarensis]|uniref:large ribosomal subunit protein uL30-like n=1 Tax=Topomyia yanbarensis TaxID=2498891 RepID=UPI00273CAD47|nr:large ribosomal subunit protein uL30-like [Topomyia yanbarensis]
MPLLRPKFCFPGAVPLRAVPVPVLVSVLVPVLVPVSVLVLVTVLVPVLVPPAPVEAAPAAVLGPACHLHISTILTHRHSRIPITDNFVIERKLRAGYKLQCVEDLVYQIYTAGALFRKINNFLWPFKLNTPTGGWRKKNNHYVEGGDFGNREDKINELISRMV